jgi:ribonuclease T2
MGSSLSSPHAPALASQAFAFDRPVHFDFYVLAQSWQPEFCRGKTRYYPGCRAPKPYWRSHFTMHGLWPELTTGKHPGYCGGAPFDLAALDHALGRATLLQYWPNVKFNTASPWYPEFWRREWARHGTCSGLDEITYFRSAVDLIRNGSATTPGLVQQNVNQVLSVEALREAFGGAKEAAVLKCDHGNVLSQVFTCWDKDANQLPTTRRACPPHVLQEDTCTRSSVFIPAFHHGRGPW